MPDLIHAHGNSADAPRREWSIRQHPANANFSRRLAFIRRRKTGDTIPFAIRPTKRAAAAPVSNCGKRRQRICRNVPLFDRAHLPPLVAFTGRLFTGTSPTPAIRHVFESAKWLRL